MYIVNVSILLPFTGRLLFLTCTPETSTDKDVEHCIESGPKPSSSGATTADMGTQNPTDMGAPKSEAMEVESSKKSEAVPLAANTSPSAKTAAACGISVTTPPAPPKVSSIISGNSPFAKNGGLKSLLLYKPSCNILIIVFWQVVRAKLTKQQREAMRLERERQRAERERQRAQKEREKAEAKARRDEEREIKKLEKQRKEEEKRLVNS